MAEVASASASSPPPPPAGGGDRKRGRSSPPLPPPPPPGPPPPGLQGGSKRHRRDEGGGGGFDRRRLGGVGYDNQDDRRYGNDHGGAGGRGGYGDERGQGRHFNCAPDWLDSGRGGWNEGLGNSHREGLKSYKQFMQELEDDISPDEAQRRYEEYKSEYITTQKKAYFDLHKNKDWMRNKYHPTNLESIMERRNEVARTNANEFFQDLQSRNLDIGPGFTSTATNKSMSSVDDADGNGKRGKLGKGQDDLYCAAPKAHPVSSEPRRIRIDIELAQALISKLDSEKGIENNVLSGSDHDRAEKDKPHGSMGPIIIIRGSSAVKGLEGAELLDTLVTYLWRIHGVDYYGMSETNDPKGIRHVKADSTFNRASSNAAEWEKKLDSFWQDRIQGQDPMEILKAKEKIDAAASEVLDPHVRKIRDEKYGWKYGCGAKGCTKLFHAPEFVLKHLKLKHEDLIVQLTSKVRENIYFENYMNDPKAPVGTHVMQQPAPREKVRQRPPIESRLRDERGNRRFDRNDSPTNDGSSDNPDDLVYDSYGDPVMHGAFPLDIPAPPVLMPVPGAGPLGPFIPAPPEVAMRMMRDQGGPPPFEPTGGPRSRRAGRGGGLPMGGPSPILASPLPPAHMHDPRKIRSYQDLDAPEDEVTVMDYRSL